ncbi:tetratricopeptide repeat protein [Salinivirga cyanobacteriivorans]
MYLYLFVGLLYILSTPTLDETEFDSLQRQIEQQTGIEKVDALFEAAELYIDRNPREALSYIKEASLLSDEIHYSLGKAKAHEKKGVIHFNFGNFEKAIKFFLEARKIYDDINDLQGIASVNNNLGKCYREMSNYSKAMQFHEKALEINQQINYQKGIADSYNNLGICFYPREEYNKVIEYIEKGMQIYREIDDKEGIAAALNNIAICYSSLGDYSKALSFFEQSLVINRKLNRKGPVGQILNNIGNLYVWLGNTQKAKYYLKQSESISRALNNRNLLKINYEAFANLYLSIEDYEKAINYYVKYSKLKDSLFSEHSDERIAKMQAIYDLEAKEQQIELLEKDNLLKKRDNRILFIILSSIAIVAGLIVYTLLVKIKNSRNKQLLLEKEKEIAKLNSKRQKENFEREMDMKNRELASFTMHVLNKNQLLIQLKDHLEEVSSSEDKDVKVLKQLRSSIEQTIDLDKDWESFATHFEKVHPKFFEKLLDQYPDLTKKELKQCAYVRMNLSTKEIATLLNITVRGVEKARSRIRNKMNLEKEVDFYDFLQNFLK